MRITREEFMSEGLRVESFFGTDVIVMHEGCGECTVISEVLNAGERYYVAVMDVSPSCMVDFVKTSILTIGKPVRMAYNGPDGFGARHFAN